MSGNVEASLKRLAEPAPPPTLAAHVMARIARESAQSVSMTPARAAQRMRERERPAAIRAVVGLALVAGLTLHGWLSIGSVPDVTSARVGIGHATLVPVEGFAWLLLGAGTWLFLTGLFAPLRRPR